MTISPATFREANREAVEVTKRGKRKLYKKISDLLRAKIAHYALQNGNAAAVQKFSKEVDAPLNESMVKSLQKSYVTVQKGKKRKTSEVDVVLESLPPKKHGYPLLLGHKLNTQVQAYIRAY